MFRSSIFILSYMLHSVKYQFREIEELLSHSDDWFRILDELYIFWYKIFFVYLVFQKYHILHISIEFLWMYDSCIVSNQINRFYRNVNEFWIYWYVLELHFHLWSYRVQIWPIGSLEKKRIKETLVPTNARSYGEYLHQWAINKC